MQYPALDCILTCGMTIMSVSDVHFLKESTFWNDERKLCRLYNFDLLYATTFYFSPSSKLLRKFIRSFVILVLCPVVSGEELRSGDRDPRIKYDNTLLHRDKDLSTSRLFCCCCCCKSWHSNTQYIKQEYNSLCEREKKKKKRLKSKTKPNLQEVREEG